MALIDREIREKKLISHEFDESNLFSIGYKFRIGQIFEAGTGVQLVKEDFIGLIIPPNGTAIVMTREKVNLPEDICAAYFPTYDLAKQGILLLNASMVEPGYEGYLSCFFVNFSSIDFALKSDEKIAEIIFYQLKDKPDKISPLKIDEKEYKSILFGLSNKFHKSFLNINSLGDKISEKTEKSVTDSIKFGGIVVALLLLFSTLEPIINKYVWGTSPVYEQRLDNLQKEIKENMELLKNIDNKQHVLDSVYIVRQEQQRLYDSLYNARSSAPK